MITHAELQHVAFAVIPGRFPPVDAGSVMLEIGLVVPADRVVGWGAHSADNMSGTVCLP